jgi:bifunctional isochorismate lyase/aryl carrier protein
MTYESLRQTLLDLMDLPEADFDPDGHLVDFGLDSIQVITLIETWHAQGIDVDLAALAERPSLNGWWQILSERGGATL